MAGALDYLFGGSQPNAVDTTTAASNGMPTWYQQYIAGIAGKGTQIAGAQANMDIPAQSVAGFNDTQNQAFTAVQNNQGQWAPDIIKANQTATDVPYKAANMVNGANNAVAGPTQTWDTNQAQQYMSPYTSQVIDNIQRLGLRNMNENLLPAVQDQFIGSGQFGSSRNADILGRTVRDANTDISGQVANALNSGYTNAQTMFTSDQTRQQQQEALQAQTGIQGATANTTAGIQSAQTLGALGQTTQQLGLNDANALNSVGTQQQTLQQQGLNTAYGNQVNANNFDWNTLNNLNSVVRGLQLPQTAIQTTNMPSTPANGLYGSSGVGAVGALSTAIK